MKLIIVRHGETIENVKRIIQGHLGGNLSREGKSQTKKLAERLKDEKIDVIYSSDLKRTRNTAREIKKFNKNIPLYFDARIRERFFGDYQGTHYENGWAWRSITSDMGGSIENDLDMEKRIATFLDEIIEKHKKETVLLVSHGGVKKLILNQIFGKHLPKIASVEEVKNASVSIFEIQSREKIIPILLNCTRHLE